MVQIAGSVKPEIGAAKPRKIHLQSAAMGVDDGSADRKAEPQPALVDTAREIVYAPRCARNQLTAAVDDATNSLK